jgi:hypothetical protein
MHTLKERFRKYIYPELKLPWKFLFLLHIRITFLCSSTEEKFLLKVKVFEH